MKVHTTNWLNRFDRSRQPRWRLICLPYAGGSAGIYRSWPAYLPDVEVLAVQYPGREDRLGEAPMESLLELSGAIATIVDSLPPLPYAVFGHSLGALIGFEVVRDLRRHGASLPHHLFVSGSSGPRINTHRQNPRNHWSDGAFITELGRMGGTPQELLDNRELMGMMLPTLRADLGAVDTYDYPEEPPLPVPLHAIGGLDDHDVSRDKLGSWREQTSAGFSMTMLAGDHFFLHSCVPSICAWIVQQMEADTAALA